MALRKCPVCNVTLKVENVERHITAVHPRQDVSSVLCEEERRSARRSSRGARPARRGVRLKRSALAAAIVVALVLGGLAYGVSRLPPPTHPGAMVLHWHPIVRISIDGQSVAVPANIGIDPALWNDHSLDQYGMQAMPEMGMGGMAPVHTHDSSGQIHVESTVVRDYTLGELFRIWGQSFDGQQLLGHPAGAGHRVRMVVDGVEQAPTYSLVFRDGMQIQIVCDSA